MLCLDNKGRRALAPPRQFTFLFIRRARERLFYFLRPAACSTKCESDLISKTLAAAGAARTQICHAPNFLLGHPLPAHEFFTPRVSNSKAWDKLQTIKCFALSFRLWENVEIKRISYISPFCFDKVDQKTVFYNNQHKRLLKKFTNARNQVSAGIYI
jgi:hypothetical protein